MKRSQSERDERSQLEAERIVRETIQNVKKCQHSLRNLSNAKCRDSLRKFIASLSRLR